METNLLCKNIDFTADVFYSLLFEFTQNKFVLGDGYKKKTEKNTQVKLFYDLNILTYASKATLGSFEGLYHKGKILQSFKNAATNFKNGKNIPKSSVIFLFIDSEIVRKFDEQIKNEYSKAFVKAVEFSRRYFDDNNSFGNTTLIQEIMYLIINDSSIDESQEFYICSDGSTKKKSDLRNIERIEFESFLLGIWHYLISSKRLQAKLSNNEKISVDLKNKELNVNLTYSDIIIDEEKPSDSQSDAYDKCVEDINANDTKANHNYEENNSPDNKISDAENSTSSQNVDEDSDIIKIPINLYHQELNANLTYNNITIHNHGENYPSKTRKKKQFLYSGIKDYHEEQIALEVQSDYYPSEIDQNIDIIAVLEDNDITLSRSIFFYLLVDAIQTDPKLNKKAIEKLFLNMLNLTADNDCKIDFGTSLVRNHHDKFRYLKEICAADCLDDESKINEFSDNIRTKYDEALCGMIKISEDYFNSNEKNETLVVSLIEFIRNDNSIEENQEFFVCSDGLTLTKKQLCEIEEIEFEAFLLGIWHYVVSQLDRKDSADEHTFNTVFKVSYTYNGKSCEQYRSADIIEEQSDMYVKLTYL